jgi:hypothetical protein
MGFFMNFVQIELKPQVIYTQMDECATSKQLTDKNKHSHNRKVLLSK